MCRCHDKKVKPKHRRVGSWILKIFVALLAVFILCFVVLYSTSRGFRRSVQFWKAISPLLIRFRFIKAKARYIDGCTEEEMHKRLAVFHKKAAPRSVEIILSLGGIYVKLGQMFSTIGSGLLDEEYVQALKPLRDGVPPRPVCIIYCICILFYWWIVMNPFVFSDAMLQLEEISAIIEKSVDKPMSSIFQHFEELPVGAASIAQAHRATLIDGTEAIVKVQYPEVAELYEADFKNMEIFTRLVNPEHIKVVESLRRRHQKELDFRIEAVNLQECTVNMQRHGFEPTVVRIPRIFNESGLATQHVLAMEYLEGVSLADAIDAEQNQIARALGMVDAAQLRSKIMNEMKQHFLDGGGKRALIGREKTVMKATSVLAPLLRTYASFVAKVSFILDSSCNFGARIVQSVTFGRVRPKMRLLDSSSNVDIDHVLKTLIKVHGYQVLVDGVYNADPHPGNVLVLPDGRLGLLDYGMVGHLTPQDRRTIAHAMLALARNDKNEVTRIYNEAGYRAHWANGDKHSNEVIHRFATFHLDRVDLSDVTIDAHTKLPIFEVLRKSREQAVPDWIVQMKRIGGLLIGTASQTARPISLSKEWEPIAKRVAKKETKNIIIMMNSFST